MARPKTTARKAPAPKPASKGRASRGAATDAPAKKRGSIGTSACGECGLLDGKHVPSCSHAIVLCGECSSTTSWHREDCSKAVREDTVDGKRAKIRQTEPPASDDNGAAKATKRRTEPPPPLKDSQHLSALQDAFDEREIVGVVQPRSKGVMCEYFRLDGSEEVGCSAFAAFKHVDDKECPSCGKKKKLVDSQFCITHAALSIAGEHMHPQTKLFES